MTFRNNVWQLSQALLYFQRGSLSSSCVYFRRPDYWSIEESWICCTEDVEIVCRRDRSFVHWIIITQAMETRKLNRTFGKWRMAIVIRNFLILKVQRKRTHALCAVNKQAGRAREAVEEFGKHRISVVSSGSGNSWNKLKEL